jgi:hypothetical protein
LQEAIEAFARRLYTLGVLTHVLKLGLDDDDLKEAVRKVDSVSVTDDRNLMRPEIRTKIGKPAEAKKSFVNPVIFFLKEEVNPAGCRGMSQLPRIRGTNDGDLRPSKAKPLKANGNQTNPQEPC